MKKYYRYILLGTIFFSLTLNGCTKGDSHTYYTVGQQMPYIGYGSDVLSANPLYFMAFDKNTSTFTFKQRLEYVDSYIYQFYLSPYTVEASYNDTVWQKNADYIMQFKFANNQRTDFIIKFKVSSDFLTKYDPYYVYPMADKLDANISGKYLIRLSLYFKGLSANGTK
jgi:hypothetical protein